MPVVPKGSLPPIPALTMVVETSEDTRVLSLKDFLDLYHAKTTRRLTEYARQQILEMLHGSSVTNSTVHKVDGSEEVDYEHAYPVIRGIADRNRWVAPRDRLIYEPELEKVVRHAYHTNQFKPVELGLTIKKRHRMTLKADREVSRYEVGGNDNSDYIPLTNTSFFGPGDRFTIFHYFHHNDVRREHPAKIFYKNEGDHLQFHCVSIPLKLFTVLIEDEDDSDEAK